MAVLSGVITGLAVCYIWYWLIWIALIPFFLALHKSSLKSSLLYGLLFGIGEGCILFNWIIDVTPRYTGNSTILGFPIFITAVIYLSVFTTVFACAYFYATRGKETGIYAISITAFTWVLLEWININTMAGIPWVKYSLGFSQSANIYGLQLISVTGQWGVSFIVVFVNLLIVHSVLSSRVRYTSLSVVVLAGLYIFGYIKLLPSVNNDIMTIKAAVLHENIKAETRWQESNGDSLASVFLDLNHRAAGLNPDIIVWSETALPWTFRKDDDLVKLALDITHETNAGHIIGILSEAENGSSKVYNSAYYIDPDGKVISRYDKIQTLSFIERPLISPALKIPFLSEGVYNNVLEGKKSSTLDTPYGKAGVMICNESLLPYRARQEVENGASFLVNISNDAWFENTELISHHFYYARMRAVETGKSTVVNSNMGIAGFIEGNGRIIEQRSSNSPDCFSGTIGIRKHQTLYTMFGDWFIYVGFLLVAVHYYIKYKGEAT